MTARKRAVATTDDPVFEEAWALYPRCPNNSKLAAKRQWEARVKQGEDPQVMLAGVVSYARYIQRTGAWVKHAATFFGINKHYLNSYDEPQAPEPESEAETGLLAFNQQEPMV